jgi:hypothetical protein
MLRLVGTAVEDSAHHHRASSDAPGNDDRRLAGTDDRLLDGADVHDPLTVAVKSGAEFNAARLTV